MKHLEALMLSLMALPLAAQTTSGTIGSYTLDPPEGQVEEISSIRITFGDLGSWWLDTPDCSGVSLTSETGGTYKVVKTEGNWENYCTMYFGTGSEPEAVTAPGKYTLSIPAGVFKQAFSSDDKQNDLITAVYTIEEPEQNTLSSYSLTPAHEGTVSALSEISVSFPDATGTGVSVVGDLSQVTLTADGVTYVCVSAEETEAATMTLKFGVSGESGYMAFTRPGDYTLFVPKNVFAATGTEETNAYKIEATFHLENADFNSMAEVVTNPAQGAVVESFSEIELIFPDATKGLDFPSDLSGLVLEKDGEPTGYLAGNVRMSAPYDRVSFGFSSTQYGDPVTFTESGTYTLKVPAGVFKESGSDLYRNGDIEFSFKVRNPEDVNPFATYTSTPADGETVGEIYQMTILFPELSEGGIQWPYDISRVTLKREGDDTVYTGNTTALKNGCEIITGFGPQGSTTADMLLFRTPGDYVVTIPAGTFVSEADPDVSNDEISLRLKVDASYNFTYTISPASGSVVSSLPDILIEPDDVLTTVGVVENSGLAASISSDDETVALNALVLDEGVLLVPASKLAPGQWTVNVPAGFLSGKNTDGLDIVNALPLRAEYTIKEPQTYTYSTTPAEAADIAMFTKYTVHVEGSPRSVKVNPEAGTPVLSGEGVELKLASSVSGADVLFAIKGGASLADGHYTVTVPAGYIVTTDRDMLQAAMPEIVGSFTVTRPAEAGYDTGMLIFNEGWYGHDMASLTHVSADGEVRYNAFLAENPDKSLGVTGTWAGRFGDKLYAVCKQSGNSLNGAEGGVLTQMDGGSLAYIDQINSLGVNEQAHSFCGYDATHGYLTTSAGIYPVDLRTMTLGERMSVAQTVSLEYGEMLRYRGRVFITADKWAPVALNPADNTMTELSTGPAVKCFVTADGSMYAATLVEGEEFVKIDPETLECKPVTIDAGEYEGRTRIADIWRTWMAAPLAVDLNDNVVYYATENYNVTAIARLDLDNGEFTPDFIKLPATESAQTSLYGQGISVDPVTGEIVINAVENGFGTHYQQNYVYRADPATGAVDETKTLKLSEDYWFPAMTVYCGFKAPELDLTDISLADGPVTIDLREHTRLALGNKHEVEYVLTTSAPDICEVTELGPGLYELASVGDGMANITVTADYNGLVTEAVFTAGVSGIMSAEATSGPVDVYTPSGVLVLRGADAEAIRGLAPGLYIAGGKKIYVK